MAKEGCSCKERVVITRMGIVSPLGNSIDEFTKRLFDGKSGIVPLKRLDEFEWFRPFRDQLPIAYAGQVEQPDLSWMGKDKNRIGRFTAYAAAAIRQALADDLVGNGSPKSWLVHADDDPYRFGIIMGVGGGGQEESENQQSRLVSRGKIRKIDPMTVCKSMHNSGSGKPAQIFSLAVAGSDGIAKGKEFKPRGSNFVVSSACASAGNAIGEMFHKIRDCYLDIGIAGGADALLTPMGVCSFYMSGAVSAASSPNGPKSFSEGRDGFYFSEGAAVVVMESLSHVMRNYRQREIIAEVVGYGATDDAYHDTQPHPEGDGAYNAMRLALEDAGILPEQVSAINAHGTGTQLNDAAETKAIKMLLGERAYEVPVSANKSQTGHSIGAAGAFEAVASALSILHKRVPPTIDYKGKDPECDLDYVTEGSRPMKSLDVVLSNSFGFTGHNACLVLREFRFGR